MSQDVQQVALSYRRILKETQQLAACEDTLVSDFQLPPERLQELQSAWALGLLGDTGTTSHHGELKILDFGSWARDGVYDLERVQLEIEGQWCSGPVMFTTRAEDWESLGYGEDEQYNDVILHVGLLPAPQNFFTRTSNQRHVPYLALDESQWKDILQIPPRLDPDLLALCRQPLRDLPAAQLQSVILSAAAHRLLCKRLRFQQRVTVLGSDQCWYEAWAEALGYYQNRFAMRVLAQRAPLKLLMEGNTEALLFGIAGFLSPILPESCDEEVRHYHRHVWDTWWSLRDGWELQGKHRIHWHMGSSRPANHPHRRVAALACTASCWDEWAALLSAQNADELLRVTSSLDHHYWKHHSSLPSKKLARPVALVGQQRMKAFLVNSLLVFDDSDTAWSLYKKQRESQVASKIATLARALAGEREDLQSWLSSCVIQQGLLQIGSDFATPPQQGSTMLFPESLGNV